MKKLKKIITTISLLSILGLCGCASKESSSENSLEKEKTENIVETGETKNTQNTAETSEIENTQNTASSEGTKNTTETKEAILVINNTFWGVDFEKEDVVSSEEKLLFEEVKSGDVLVETSFGTLKVDTITEEQIIISIIDGCYVERDGDGVNLRAEPLTQIELRKGESIDLSSASMDAGNNLTISFK